MLTGRRYLTSYPVVIGQRLTSDIKMIFVQNSLKSDDVSDWPLLNKIPGCAPADDAMQMDVHKTLYPFYPISLCRLKSFVWIGFCTSAIRNALSFHKLPNIHFFGHFLQTGHNLIMINGQNNMSGESQTLMCVQKCGVMILFVADFFSKRTPSQSDRGQGIFNKFVIKYSSQSKAFVVTL